MIIPTIAEISANTDLSVQALDILGKFLSIVIYTFGGLMALGLAAWLLMRITGWRFANIKFKSDPKPEPKGQISEAISANALFKSLEASYQTSLARMEKQHSDQIAQMEVHFKERIASIERTHAEHKESLLHRVLTLEDILKRKGEEADGTDERHAKVIADLRAAHENTVAKLRHRMNEVVGECTILETKLNILRSAARGGRQVDRDLVIKVIDGTHNGEAGDTMFGLELARVADKNARKFGGDDL